MDGHCWNGRWVKFNLRSSREDRLLKNLLESSRHPCVWSSIKPSKNIVPIAPSAVALSSSVRIALVQVSTAMARRLAKEVEFQGQYGQF
jgi:hypothetical protein